MFPLKNCKKIKNQYHVNGDFPESYICAAWELIVDGARDACRAFIVEAL